MDTLKGPFWGLLENHHLLDSIKVPDFFENRKSWLSTGTRKEMGFHFYFEGVSSHSAII